MSAFLELSQRPSDTLQKPSPYQIWEIAEKPLLRDPVSCERIDTVFDFTTSPFSRSTFLPGEGFSAVAVSRRMRSERDRKPRKPKTTANDEPGRSGRFWARAGPRRKKRPATRIILVGARSSRQQRYAIRNFQLSLLARRVRANREELRRSLLARAARANRDNFQAPQNPRFSSSPAPCKDLIKYGFIKLIKPGLFILIEPGLFQDSLVVFARRGRRHAARGKDRRFCFF